MAQNTSHRGFASMDESKQREIASKGGKASGEQRARISAAKKRNQIEDQQHGSVGSHRVG